MGFTPEHFILVATPEAVASICAAHTAETETSAQIVYAECVQQYNGNEHLSMRCNSRILTDNTFSGGRVNTDWTTQTNNYLYTNGTSIYFRTASGYGFVAGEEFNWIALAR